MPHILYIYTIYIYIYICSRAYRAVHFILRCFSVLFYDSSTWVGGCVTRTHSNTCIHTCHLSVFKGGYTNTTNTFELYVIIINMLV